MAMQTMEEALSAALQKAGVNDFGDGPIDEPESADDGKADAKQDETAAAGEQEEEPSGETEAEDSDSDETGAEEETTGKAVDLPEHWSAERKQLFESLPEDDRPKWLEELKSIEKGFNDKHRELADDRKLAGEIRQAVEPVKTQLEAQGVSPAELVSQYVNWQRYLSSQPADALGMLVEHYGRPVAGTAQARDLVRRVSAALGIKEGADAAPKEEPQDGDQDYLDPAAAREIKALRAELSEIKGNQKSKEEQEAQWARADLEAEIARFRSAQAEDGSPKHPHFDAVRQHMGALMQAASAEGRQLSLEDAYDAAVWANAQTRQQLLDAQAEQQRRKAEEERAEQAKKAEAERKQAVKRSKQASSSPKARGAPNGQAVASGSWSETLETVLDRYDVPI